MASFGENRVDEGQLEHPAKKMKVQSGSTNAEVDGVSCLNYFDAKSRTDAIEFDKPIDPHPAELYRATDPEIPSDYNSVRKGGLAAVSESHADAYGRQGYLVVEDAFSRSEVDGILTSLRETIKSADFQCSAHQTVRAQAAGEIDLAKGGLNPVLQFEAFAEELPLAERYQLENVRKMMGFHKAHPTLASLASHEPMLSVVRKLLLQAGCTADQVAEIEIFQSLALLKPPGGREKPWHQDNSYFDVDSKEVKMAGAWIALSEVTVDSGAMHVLPGPLDKFSSITHFSRRDWQICDSEVLSGKHRCVAVPLHPGGMLFFSTMLPHGTPTNTSATPRYAVQFHFIPKCFTKRINTAERKACWGEEGKAGVSC